MCSEHERYDMRGLFMSSYHYDTLIKAIMTTNHYQSLLPSEVIQYFIASNINTNSRLKLEIKNYISAPFHSVNNF